MNVRQILNLKGSSAITTIAPNATIAQAAVILGEKRIGALVVATGDDNISGIISERDIVRGLGKHGAPVLDAPVSTLMTANVVTCAPSDSSDAVLGQMTDGRFRHLPVMEGGKMTGFLSIGDVVKAKIKEIEDENAAMAGMLAG